MSQIISNDNLVNIFTCWILLTATQIIFMDKLEFLVIKSFIVYTIIVARILVEKPNASFTSGGKLLIKDCFASLLLMLALFDFSDLLDFYLCY